MIRKIKIAIVTLSLAIMFLASGCGATDNSIIRNIIPIETTKTEDEDFETIPEENIDATEEIESVENFEEISKDLILKHKFTTFKFIGKKFNDFCKNAKFSLFFVKICTADFALELLCVDIKSIISFTSDDGVIHTETLSSLDNLKYQDGELSAEIIINFSYLGEYIKISENKLIATLKRVGEADFVATFTIKLTKDISVKIECNLTSDLVEEKTEA